MPETAEIRRLRDSVDRLAKAVEKERQARRQTVIVLVVAAGLFVGAVVIGGLLLLGQVHRVDDAVIEIETTRANNRVASCNSYNEDTVDKINGILLRVTSDPARVEPLLLARRDCSEAGIDDYFDNDPATDPFVPVTIPEEP